MNGMLETQLDGVLQKFDKTFFLFRPAGLYRLAFMTAEWAKEERLAAFAPEHMDAFAAHDFAAIGAFVGGGSP